MLKMEEWLLIRDLYSQGFSISEIARQTGFDRKTVRKYLQQENRYQNPRNVPEEKASLILTNLTFLKNSMKVPILLLASIEKSKKWVLMEEKLSSKTS